MNTLLIDTLIGAFVGLFAGLISQNTTSWKIFAFLWGAPLSLFIPLYISYNREKSLLNEFLKHSTLGILLALTVTILTYILIKINIKLALITNFIISFLVIYFYFYYRIFDY